MPSPAGLSFDPVAVVDALAALSFPDAVVDAVTEAVIALPVLSVEDLTSTLRTAGVAAKDVLRVRRHLTAPVVRPNCDADAVSAGLASPSRVVEHKTTNGRVKRRREWGGEWQGEDLREERQLKRRGG